MILVKRGQYVEVRFVFVSNDQIYDPANLATPVDVYFSILRGDNSSGPIIDGPFSYLRGNSDIAEKVTITRSGNGQYTFKYKVASNLLPGIYSVNAQTSDASGSFTITSAFQVKGDPVTLNPVVISNNSSAVVNYTPTFNDLNRSNTSTVLLIGHSDNMQFNVPVKVHSMQSAIDLLGADVKSPLMRGVLNAYAAGARDLFILAAAPMSEYAEYHEDRVKSSLIFDLESATPSSMTFYQKYYQRLATTYNIIKELDFIDYVVPLEASIIKTGGVDFISQLAAYLADFHNSTGFVQLGIIGSKSGGVSSSDISDLKSNSVLANKLTQYGSNGTISSDIGRFVIPVYGEAVYQHSSFNTSYSSPVAASYAGMFASSPLNMGLIRTRIPGAMTLFGSDLSQADINQLESIGVNTIYRGHRTRRSTPYEVYCTNEYTLANLNSTLSKAAQMRLVATVINQVKLFAYDAIGRFGYEKAVDRVRALLEDMKIMNIIVNFSFNVEVDPNERGKLIFYIELLSALGLKKIDFAIAAGPEA